jgi:hypothetical protein
MLFKADLLAVVRFEGAHISSECVHAFTMVPYCA